MNYSGLQNFCYSLFKKFLNLVSKMTKKNKETF